MLIPRHNLPMPRGYSIQAGRTSEFSGPAALRAARRRRGRLSGSATPRRGPALWSSPSRREARPRPEPAMDRSCRLRFNTCCQYSRRPFARMIRLLDGRAVPNSYRETGRGRPISLGGYDARGDSADKSRLPATQDPDRVMRPHDAHGNLMPSSAAVDVPRGCRDGSILVKYA